MMQEGTISQAMCANLEAGKGKEMASPPKSPEGTEPCLHVDFKLLTPRTIINLYCFKPLSLWQFVTIAI